MTAPSAITACALLAAVACLDPAEPPRPLAACPRPAADTTTWQRVGSVARSVRLPATFEAAGRDVWALNRTRVALRTASNVTNTGQPSELVLRGECTALINGRSAVIEFAESGSELDRRHHVVATWKNIRSLLEVFDVVYDASTYNDSDLSLLLAIAWTVNIVETTGPGARNVTSGTAVQKPQ